MKISVSTLGMYPATIDKVLEFVTSDLKLDYLEIVKEYPYHNLTQKDFENYDINLSIHAPMSDINIASHVDKVREASITEMIDSFKAANEWGADRVVVHPGTIPIMGLKFTDKILNHNLESLIRLDKIADEYGVMMCVENMPLFERMLYTNIDALFELVENDLNCGITMDVGHAYNNGFCEEEMFNSDNIHHVHLSDNDGSFDMHHELGRDDIDFPKIFKILKEKKYDDISVIEVKTKQQILKSIDYLKKINVL